MSSLWQDLSDSTLNFRPWPWPLTYILKPLTLHITFIPLDIGLSYWAVVFFMTRPFRWDYTFWSHNLDHDLWPSFEKNFNSAHNFPTIRHGAFIFNMGRHVLLLYPLLPNAIIHIKYHIKMSVLVPHAFLGMPFIFCCLRSLYAYTPYYGYNKFDWLTLILRSNWTCWIWFWILSLRPFCIMMSEFAYLLLFLNYSPLKCSKGIH